jgi:hypothetical protein
MVRCYAGGLECDMENRVKIMVMGTALSFVFMAVLLSGCVINLEPLQPAIDKPGLTVKPTNGLLTTESGGKDSFSVILDSKPSANVVIGIHCNDPSEGVINSSSLVFTSTNWNRSQMVTITGVDDAVADGNKVCKVVLDPAVSADSHYNGFDADDVKFTNVDDDAPGITVNPTGGLFTTEAGGTDSFIVMLNSEPFSDVAIDLSSSDASEGTVYPDSLIFTSASWNVPHEVIVTGVNDTLDDEDQEYWIVTEPAVSSDGGYSLFDAEDVSVTNIDDDPGFTVNPAGWLLTTEAGGMDSFTLVMNSEPTADVTVDLSSSDTSEGTVNPISLTFTPANWYVPRTVTLTGADDLISDGSKAYICITGLSTSADPSYDSIDPADVSVFNKDDEPQVAAGAYHTLEVRSDGTLWAWGNNGSGMLGDGTGNSRNTPIQICVDTDWALVAVGYEHSLAVKTDCSLWAWGSNVDSKLGDGTTTGKNIPIMVGDDSDWAQVSAGYYHSLALKNDGTLWAWGFNGNGELGDGDAWEASPVKIH